MLNCEDKIINSIESIDSEVVFYDESDFHIVYGADKEFLYGTGISIASVIINNPGLSFHFHIFSDCVDHFDHHRFSDLVERYNTKITFYTLHANYLKNLNIDSKSWNDSIYFRLIGIDYLSMRVSKLLYLDSDIICKNKINGLLVLDFKSNSLLAVHDRLLNPNFDKYFNSGFLYFDCSKIKEKCITEAVLSLVINNDFTHPDQDALNIIFSGKVGIIGKEYNDFFSIDSSIKKNNDFSKISSDTVFIHYVGITKPWHNWYQHTNETMFFETARMQTSWAGELLKNASTYKQMSRKYSHLKNDGKFLSALIAYIKYLKMKIGSQK